MRYWLVAIMMLLPQLSNAETLLGRCTSGDRTLDVYQPGDGSPEAVVVVRHGTQLPTLVSAALVPAPGASFAYSVKPDPVWGIPEIPASQCRAPAPAAVASALKPALRSPALSGGETVESEMCLYFVMESEMNHPLADLIASHDAIVFKAMVQCVLAAPGSSATSPCTEIRIPETKIPVDSSAAPMCSVF